LTRFFYIFKIFSTFLFKKNVHQNLKILLRTSRRVFKATQTN